MSGFTENTIVGVTGADAPVVEDKDKIIVPVDTSAGATGGADTSVDTSAVTSTATTDAGATGADTSATGAIDKKQFIRKIDNVNDVKPGETAYKIVETAGGDVVVKDSNENVVTDTISAETKQTIFDFINPVALKEQEGGRRRSRRNRRQNGKRQSKKRQQNRQSKNKKQNGGKKRRNSKRNQKK